MMRMQMLVSIALAFALMCAAAQPARAQGVPPEQEKTDASAGNSTGQAAPASDAEAADKLRKAAQNPVASLISVPIQENWNFNIGPADRTQNVMNIQPVIPMNAGKNWNLIIRWIAPVVFQPFPVSCRRRQAPMFNPATMGLETCNRHFLFRRRRAK